MSVADSDSCPAANCSRTCNPDKGYALSKLKSYWEYLCDGLEDGNKLYRKLKKAKSLDEFREELLEFMEE